MTGVSVAEATSADLAGFAAFMREAWQSAGPGAPGFTGATDEVIAEITETEAFQARIGGPDRRMLLAWEDGEVVGFAATKRLDATMVELAGIVVKESAAGRGIGTALVEQAIDTARAEKHRTMVVRTETTNHRAKAFYESCGFTHAHRTTEDVDGATVEVWELTRDLED
jgi:GNAT superfamily N-acetyltransferase